MDCEPVELWRRKFHLNLSASWKHDVEVTVTDLALWKSILDGWGYWKNGKWVKKSPAIKPLLDYYEQLQFDREDAIRAQRNGIHSEEGISKRSERVLPKLEMPPLLERSRGQHR